jgi:hypothetical protein
MREFGHLTRAETAKGTDWHDSCSLSGVFRPASVASRAVGISTANRVPKVLQLKLSGEFTTALRLFNALDEECGVGSLWPPRPMSSDAPMAYQRRTYRTPPAQLSGHRLASAGRWSAAGSRRGHSSDRWEQSWATLAAASGQAYPTAPGWASHPAVSPPRSPDQRLAGHPVQESPCAARR